LSKLFHARSLGGFLGSVKTIGIVAVVAKILPIQGANCAVWWFKTSILQRRVAGF